MTDWKQLWKEEGKGGAEEEQNVFWVYQNMTWVCTSRIDLKKFMSKPKLEWLFEDQLLSCVQGQQTRTYLFYKKINYTSAFFFSAYRLTVQEQ